MNMTLRIKLIKETWGNGAGNVVQLVECLPGTHEALRMFHRIMYVRLIQSQNSGGKAQHQDFSDILDYILNLKPV